ncbi:hypothetical protein DHD80_06005 [Gramella sp. AN32]|nr:hypothetical protein [Gramella sp. AN32]
MRKPLRQACLRQVGSAGQAFSNQIWFSVHRLELVSRLMVDFKLFYFKFSHGYIGTFLLSNIPT